MMLKHIEKAIFQKQIGNNNNNEEKKKRIEKYVKPYNWIHSAGQIKSPAIFFLLAQINLFFNIFASYILLTDRASAYLSSLKNVRFTLNLLSHDHDLPLPFIHFVYLSVTHCVHKTQNTTTQQQNCSRKLDAGAPCDPTQKQLKYPKTSIPAQLAQTWMTKSLGNILSLWNCARVVLVALNKQNQQITHVFNITNVCCFFFSCMGIK